ncbi:MAG: hypothetical protein FWC87_10365, partial [Acidimicrobiaceae bacterium]|nr:hypothetical protein [Acidimicrobiaceae bacterium]
DSLLSELSASEPAFALPLGGGRIGTSSWGRRPRRVNTLVGLAGTVAALARLDQELTSYDRDRVHHHLLSRETVEKLLASLASQSVAERLERPGMEAERADVIVGGTLVLAALLRHFEIDACLTSEADILDGLAMTLLAGS